MKTLLQIHTSLHGAESLSSSLANDYVEQWQLAQPNGRIISRDLSSSPVPHLTAERFSAFAVAPDERDEEQRTATELSDELISELRAADEILIALPMHNFNVPSTLKAYFDHVARAGETFRYTSAGPVGLLTGKRAIIVATRGGRYEGTPSDLQTEYMKRFLAFLGITETNFVYAEGIASGGDSLTRSIENARQQIRTLRTAAA